LALRGNQSESTRDDDDLPAGLQLQKKRNGQ
jgi:hypothetical protein